MADASARPARAADVAEIVRIQLVTWATAYRDILPPEALGALTPELATAQWAAAVSQPPSPRHRVMVAQEGENVVGFAAVEPADPDEAEQAAIITTMLVEPRWGRRGHGSRLLAATVDAARADGTTRLLAWVPQRDAASLGFYRSAGWEQDGWARTLDVLGTPLREVRLHTDLREDSGP